jgi:hypothetical protein
LQQIWGIHDEGGEQRAGMIAVGKPKTRHPPNLGLGNWFASTSGKVTAIALAHEIWEFRHPQRLQMSEFLWHIATSKEQLSALVLSFLWTLIKEKLEPLAGYARQAAAQRQGEVTINSLMVRTKFCSSAERVRITKTESQRQRSRLRR